MRGRRGLVEIFLSDERGSLLSMEVAGVTVLGFTAALVVDVGRASMIRDELKGTANSAALASVVELPDAKAARTMAFDYAQENACVVRRTVTTTIEEEDTEQQKEFSTADCGDEPAVFAVDVGIWDSDTRAFTVSDANANAVRASLTS